MEVFSKATLTTFLGTFEVRKLAPMPINYPGVGRPCFFCQSPVDTGDIFCLIPTRPPDQLNYLRMLYGQPFTVLQEVAHWACLEKFAQTCPAQTKGVSLI